MVARTYAGLGPPDAAVTKFNNLSPYVLQMMELQAECVQFSPDYLAISIALDGVETAAFHFTRRPHFYSHLERPAAREGNGRLKDPKEAAAAFDALVPYANALRLMQGGCRPFGRDYMAIAIAQETLDSAAFHFTREARFFGSKSDSAGPTGPRR
ncbi:MAG: hypothetical protein V4597_18480 [Pseudomonadota bacterium]